MSPLITPTISNIIPSTKKRIKTGLLHFLPKGMLMSTSKNPIIKLMGVLEMNQSKYPRLIPIREETVNNHKVNIDKPSMLAVGSKKPYLCTNFCEMDFNTLSMIILFNQKLNKTYAIKLLTIFAEFKQSGIPPPGWTEPPQKYRFFIFPEKLACLKKAAYRELLEVP